MDPLILDLGTALAVGLLVGLERAWRERDQPEGSRTAGFRTYGIIGLLGGLFAALSGAMHSAAVLVGGFAVFAAIFAWFKMREARHDENFSVTGVIAALLVFALGALAVAGDRSAAAAGGAALAATLAAREMLHGLVRRISWIELRSALLLAVMTAVGMPLMPNHAIDPWGGFIPAQVWLFTVLTAALSYLGYIAVRVLGTSKGLVASALAGALVSSTAATVAFGRMAKAGGNPRPFAGAALLAAMVSILRVLAITAAVAPAILGVIALPALGAGLVFGAGGLALTARSDVREPPALGSRNPFDLVPLLVFAALFGTVSMASAALVDIFGAGSLVATSALSGSFDVDVAVLSALRLANGGLGPEIIGHAVLAALLANAAGRLSLAVATGPAAYWAPLFAATAVAALAGYAIFLLVPAGMMSILA